MGNANILKHWETGYVNCASLTVPQLITTLRGGESVTLKSHENSGDYHKIGADKVLILTQGYLLGAEETMTLTLPIIFGADNYIEIYALPSAHENRYVSFFKLIDLYPVTAGD
ncbi:unnamed protein product [marine sediment metagenome]|uniref:Uncharacterized protein n=1 Tax=marine sediment metagenome TaxID=412755 RepID=X1JZK5_9ZZZZ